MAILWIVIILIVAALLFIFLYSLMKVARLSDVRAGYDEGMLYDTKHTDHHK